MGNAVKIGESLRKKYYSRWILILYLMILRRCRDRCVLFTEYYWKQKVREKKRELNYHHLSYLILIKIYGTRKWRKKEHATELMHDVNDIVLLVSDITDVFHLSLTSVTSRIFKLIIRTVIFQFNFVSYRSYWSLISLRCKKRDNLKIKIPEQI